MQKSKLADQIKAAEEKARKGCEVARPYEVLGYLKTPKDVRGYLENRTAFIASKRSRWFALGYALYKKAPYVAVLGGSSNIAVIVANNGAMPVMDPWARLDGLHKMAVPGDHLLFLCDRIRLIGQQTLMAKVGELLPDWPPTARLADLLMAGSFTVSAGDILILTALAMLATSWILRRKGRI